MRTKLILGAALSALLLAACDNAGDPEQDKPIPPAEDTSSAEPRPSGAGDRARDALGEAGTAARQTLENLGEAGRAGVEALQENAPGIREGLSNAGDRLRRAGEALVEDPARPDAPGDSEADPNETPEALERPAQ